MSIDKKLNVDTRSLNERRAEIAAKMEKKLGKDTYAAFVEMMDLDRLKYRAISLQLGPEDFDQFLAVFRDTLEADAHETFAVRDNVKRNKWT